MDKNILLTAFAVAIVVALGYAAYTNGSFGDLGQNINSQILSALNGGKNYLSAALSTQGLATSTTKAAGTRERNLPGTLKILPINPKTLNVDSEKTKRFFKFQITARKNNDDVIKYIDFQINGKGVYINSPIIEATSDKMHIDSTVNFVSGDPKKQFVIRYGNGGSLPGLIIPKGETHFYTLTVYYHANGKYPPSVMILKIAR